MLSPGQISRNQAMDLQKSRNPATLERVLSGLDLMRKCRLHREATCRQVFTLEDILYTLEEVWDHKFEIPHRLYGSIAVQAVKQNIILHSGYGRATRGSSNHRECRTYCWANPDNVKPVAP